MYVSPARIAHMYYEQGLTQQQIANETSLSRIRVSRILQQARVDGTVTITIDYGRFDPTLEARLSEIYPDTRIVVSDSIDGSTDALTASLGATTAHYLAHTLRDVDSLAIGWGTTLRAVAERLDDSLAATTFVPLLGGQVHAGLDVHANSIAEVMAARSGGSAMRIFAPAIAESVEARDTLVRSASVRQTLARAAGADAVLFSVGAPFAAGTTLGKIGYFTAEEIEQLRDSGAQCDLISLAYFDADGETCGQELSDRTVSLTLDELSSIPTKICVAGGESKHEAVRIALGLGLVDVLVTDERTARSLAD